MVRISYEDYVPILRSKKGERDAVERLSPAALHHTRPQWVIPARSQKDIDERRFLDPDEYVHLNGKRIALSWGPRPSFVDTRFVLHGFDTSVLHQPLLTLFRTIREGGGRPAPVIDLATLSDQMVDAFRAICKEQDYGLAIRLDVDQMQLPDLTARMRSLLADLGSVSQSATILLDFENAEIKDDDDSAALVEDVRDRVMAGATWGSVVFQATSYPQKNPAPKNGIASASRHEFHLWRRIFGRAKKERQILVFGDYGADHAKFAFDGGARATPHTRYVSDSSWVVSKGDGKAKWAITMPSVAKRIVERDDFAGEGYSWGDAKLVDIADGQKPGNPTTWRTINMTHHIETTCRGIGGLLHIEMPEYSSVRAAEQLSFLEKK